MSVVAAAEEDVNAGKHMRLADLYFLCTLPADALPAEEREAAEKDLKAGIDEYGK